MLNSKIFHNHYQIIYFFPGIFKVCNFRYRKQLFLFNNNKVIRKHAMSPSVSNEMSVQTKLGLFNINSNNNMIGIYLGHIDTPKSLSIALYI